MLRARGQEGIYILSRTQLGGQRFCWKTIFSNNSRYPTEQTSRSNLKTLVDSLALIKYYTGYLVIERIFLTFALVYEKNERGYIDS